MDDDEDMTPARVAREGYKSNRVTDDERREVRQYSTRLESIDGLIPTQLGRAGISIRFVGIGNGLTHPGFGLCAAVW